MAEGKKSVFQTLAALNVNGHTESKNGLTYLSWAWAWAETVKLYPDATYEIVKYEGRPYYFDPLTGYMVYTRVTIDGDTREMWLPVMDSGNNAMKAEPYEVVNRFGKKTTVKPATMFDVNKTIMRCLTKNLAMFGLGLYIYAGEDLPEEEEVKAPAPVRKSSAIEEGRKLIIGLGGATPQERAASANKAIEGLAKLKADADDRALLWSELQARGTDLGLIYDKAAKEFVPRDGNGESA